MSNDSSSEFCTRTCCEFACGGSGAPASVFLFVGRLETIKGVETLLPVFRRYSYADLLIAGDGTYGAD